MAGRGHRKRRNTASLPVLPPLDAAGVAYTANDAAPGLKFFTCGPHAMSLSQRGCGARWRAAQLTQGPAAEEAYACRTCPIGAAHAGSAHIASSRLFGAPICPRCRFGATRIIGGRVCVNCYNREREMIAGKNARGNLPTTLLRERPLRIAVFCVTVDGKSERREVEGVVDMLEPVLQTLRTTKGEIWFSFAGQIPEVSQGDLFRDRGVGGGRWTIERRGRSVRRPRAYQAPVQGELWPEWGMAA